MATGYFSNHMKVVYGIWVFHKWSSVSRDVGLLLWHRVGSGLLDVVVLEVSGGERWHGGSGSGPSSGRSIINRDSMEFVGGWWITAIVAVLSAVVLVPVIGEVVVVVL